MDATCKFNTSEPKTTQFSTIPAFNISLVLCDIVWPGVGAGLRPDLEGGEIQATESTHNALARKPYFN